MKRLEDQIGVILNKHFGITGNPYQSVNSYDARKMVECASELAAFMRSRST
jgi:hypothetical protein